MPNYLTEIAAIADDAEDLQITNNLCNLRREHLTPEDLQKNKAMMENLTKGNIMENCDVRHFISQVCRSVNVTISQYHNPVYR